MHATLWLTVLLFTLVLGGAEPSDPTATPLLVAGSLVGLGVLGRPRLSALSDDVHEVQSGA